MLHCLMDAFIHRFINHARNMSSTERDPSDSLGAPTEHPHNPQDTFVTAATEHRAAADVEAAHAELAAAEQSGDEAAMTQAHAAVAAEGRQ